MGSNNQSSWQRPVCAMQALMGPMQANFVLPVHRMVDSNTLAPWRDPGLITTMHQQHVHVCAHVSRGLDHLASCKFKTQDRAGIRSDVLWHERATPAQSI